MDREFQLRERIRELEAALTFRTLERDTAQAELAGTSWGRNRTRIGAQAFDHVREGKRLDELADEEKRLARAGKGNPTLRKELREKAAAEHEAAREIWRTNTLT